MLANAHLAERVSAGLTSFMADIADFVSEVDGVDARFYTRVLRGLGRPYAKPPSKPTPRILTMRLAPPLA